jgi:serine/threonine protein kinase
MSNVFRQLNVLIDDGCHAQLCDFGLAVVGDATQGRMTTTARGVGSGVWQSPERLLGERHRRTVADDVYAVGCLAYYVSHAATCIPLLNPSQAHYRFHRCLRDMLLSTNSTRWEPR